MNRFENKVVVITGAAGGIGEATTRRIVSEGGKVVIADHSEKKAEQLANELTHAGADVRHVYFSATELQSCKELIDFSMNEYQRIDVLINNVGGTDPKRDLNIEKLDINYFDEAFHLNLCCTMYLSQQVIPIMTTNGGGNIVNVASISGLTADANGTLYGASKAGVINLTKYIATQMGKKNNWGTRNRRKAATASAGEMSTKLNIHTFCNPRKGRCGAAFRGFCFAVKEVLCGIYKSVFWRKNGLFVPNWITFWSRTIKKGGLPNHEESEKGSVPGAGAGHGIEPDDRRFRRGRE